MKTIKAHAIILCVNRTPVITIVTRKAICMLLLLCIQERLLCQSPEWDWVRVLGGNDVDLAYSMALGTAGQVYTTGFFRGTADFDPGPGSFEFTSAGANDMFISKLDADGNFTMASQMSGWNYQNGNAITVDDAGNIYTSGEFWGTSDFDPGPDTYNLNSEGQGDIFVSKLDAAGNFLWAVGVGAQQGDWANAMTLDASGNVYITGWFQGVCDFDPGPSVVNLSSNGNVDIFILKLDPLGNFIWAKGIGGAGQDQGYFITVDGNENVYTTGHYQSNADFDPGPGVVLLDAGGSFILKLNSGGNYIWAKGLGNNGGECYGQGLDVDGSGNVYSSGYYFESGDFDPGSGVFTLSSAGGFDIYISKLDASGNFVWAKGIGGAGDDFGQELVLDAYENVFITGSFSGESDFDPGSGTFNLISEGGLDLFIAKLNSTGNFAWAIPAGGLYDEYSYSIAVNTYNDIYITGGFDSPDISFGPIFPENSATYDSPDIFVSKLINTSGTLPSVSITSYMDVLCHGETSGSAIAQATGGTPPYEYEWSNGASGPELINVAAGIYSVTATDNSSATAQATIEITEPSLLILLPASILHVNCNGGNTGSIQAAVTGGVVPYAFIWSNGETGESISNLSAGTYSVTVTDSHGCIQADTYEVSEPAPITIQLTSLIHESCDGENDGMIAIETTGGVAPYTVEWSNGQSGNELSGLSPGEYSVTITDQNLCYQTAVYTILQGSLIEVSLLQLNNVSCAGGSDGSILISAAGGVEPLLYEWSNGATEPFISSLVSGVYTVTVTDNHGCQRIEQYIIDEPEFLSIEILQAEENICYGDSTADLLCSVAGGTDPYTAIWSNGISGFANTNLIAGTYSVTITDAHGCTSIAIDTVVDPLPIVLDLMVTNETAQGANDGTITASASGGILPFQYIWSTGDSTSVIIGLPPGTYSVTITDANGCLNAGEAEIFSFGCTLDLSLGADTMICVGDTLHIIPSLTGGLGEISYAWSDGSSASSLTVYEAHEYCLTVTDSLNCKNQDCIWIQFSGNSFPTFTKSDESMYGGADGKIEPDTIIPGISYLWSTGDTTSSLLNLSPGTYCVTLTNNANCESHSCFTIDTFFCQMDATAIVDHIDCAGEWGGTITISVTGAVEPVGYEWANHGDLGPMLSGLGAGIYPVLVTDANGCTEQMFIEVTENTPIMAIQDSLKHIYGVNHGYIYITPGGGVPPYSFVWTDPLGIAFYSEDLEDLSVPGVYNLDIIDSLGCVGFASYAIALYTHTLNPGLGSEPKIYPNPASDVVYVQYDKPVQLLQITGLDGQVYLETHDPSQQAIDISSLGAGLYLFRIFDGAHWYIGKMAK